MSPGIVQRPTVQLAEEEAVAQVVYDGGFERLNVYAQRAAGGRCWRLAAAEA